MRRLVVSIGLCIAGALHPAAAAELYGLLRERDLTPFGISRLDMQPAHAIDLSPGTWTVEVNVGYQNTWASSPEVQKYLESFGSGNRHRLGAADVSAIEVLPGDNYLVDTELAALDITVHHSFSKVWSGYLTGSALSYQGGFLDGLIEEVHTAFGIEEFGRPAVRRNDINYIFAFKSGTVTQVATSPRAALTDPTIGFRYAGVRMSQSWRLVLEGAVKIPLRSYDPWFSTGRGDYGAQISLQHLGAKQGIYLSFAGVHYAGVKGPVPQESQTIPTWVIGYERALTARTNVVVQGYVSNSVYSKRETDLDRLTAKKYLLSLGLRHRSRHGLYTVALTENLQNMDNTPDIGLQFGYFYVP